jgi:hypothetical protein
MAATQLGLYNSALRILGEEKLASLSEDREPKRVLDGIWDDGLINRMLEQGQWNFATRTARLDYESSIEPVFGYRRAFEKPTDCIRLIALSVDEYFSIPLNQYRDEAGFWFCDYDQIYVSYVSNDDEYGNDLSLWPETFKRYVENYLALHSCERLTQNKSKFADLFKITERALIDARSKDAMGGPTRFMPPGSWTTARRAGRSNDRGNRGSLIG